MKNIELIGRTILYFLVNSPKGTIFLSQLMYLTLKTVEKIVKMTNDIMEEIGEDNVVHIVTNNATKYKAAREMLVAKRKKSCILHLAQLIALI